MTLLSTMSILRFILSNSF